MVLRDPDTIINWERIDEPGENPKWESKCGIVEQRTFGDDPTYYGWFGPDRKPITAFCRTTLASAKLWVESEFIKDYPNEILHHD